MASKKRGIQFDSPNEREVFHAKESWIPVVLGAIPIVVLGIVAFAVAWRFFNNSQVGLILLGVSIVVAFGSRVPRIIDNLDTDVIITDKRLYARTGIIDIKDKVCDLSNISDVTVNPSIFGRMFDYANIRVQTYAGEDDFNLRGIARAYDMRRAISQGADASGDAATSASSASYALIGDGMDNRSKTMRLQIERMAYSADSVAHDEDGKTVFVAGGVPGDLVDAAIVQEEKTFTRAVVTELLEPSDYRVKPACPFATACGGCPWASLAYETQTQAKRANVVDALVRIGHMDAPKAEKLVAPCESPSKPWGYRNKVELAFERQGRRAFVGMHGATPAEGGKPSVIKVNTCPLLDARHKKLVKSVSGALSYLAGSSALGLERVGIRASSRTKDVEIALWTKPGPFPRAQVAKVLRDAAKATSIVRVMIKGSQKARKIAGVEALAGRGHWRERIAEETMTISAPSFFQVNTAGAEKLVELVLEGLDPTKDDEAMDLYCGAGTFTLPLGHRAGWVSAVESYGPAVRDLRRNLDAANLTNAEPIGGDAGREFPDGEADIIVVDPPRVGLSADVVQQLCEQPARAIAYVSCDPATLSRDLARFAKDGRYSPVRITPVDLFPQTFHVETVCLLTHS